MVKVQTVKFSGLCLHSLCLHIVKGDRRTAAVQFVEYCCSVHHFRICQWICAYIYMLKSLLFFMCFYSWHGCLYSCVNFVFFSTIVISCSLPLAPRALCQ